MNRRQLLRGALGLGALPALISTAFVSTALASGPPDAQKAALSKAWHQAAKGSTLLLAILIPSDDGDKWTRGQALGEWLNNASDAQLAPLGQVVVVCASAEDLTRLVPQVQVQDGDWFVVVDPQAPQHARSLAVSLPKPPRGEPNFGEEGFYGEKHDAWVAKKIAGNTVAIEGVLLPALNELAGPPPPERLAELAAQVRATIISEPPPGAHWASAGGCGTHVEGIETQMLIGCGMGHVPAASRRFLYFHDVSNFRGF